MSETVTLNAPPIGAQSASAPKRPRRSPPPKFPNRITVCFDDEQVEILQQVKQSFRTTESFVIRMAFDTFCRTNGFDMSNGDTRHGR